MAEPNTNPQTTPEEQTTPEAQSPPEKTAPDYIAALEDIRAITQGVNAQHRMMTWREAVEVWEQAQGASDERARAAFFVHIGIATTGECLLLDGTEE